MFDFDKTVIHKRKLTEPSPDKGYWLTRSHLERLEALEFLRQNHHQNDNVANTFQRVSRITRRKPS